MQYGHGHNNHNFSKMFGKLMLIQLMELSANNDCNLFRTVTKILSYRVYSNSIRGIEDARKFFPVLFFLSSPMKVLVAEGPAYSCQGKPLTLNDSPVLFP